jgi:hypothetical protein
MEAKRVLKIFYTYAEGASLHYVLVDFLALRYSLNSGVLSCFLFIASKPTYRMASCLVQTNGERQADALADLLSCKSDSSFRDVQIIADYAGIPRFVTAFRC